MIRTGLTRAGPVRLANNAGKVCDTIDRRAEAATSGMDPLPLRTGARSRSRAVFTRQATYKKDLLNKHG